MLGYYLGLDWIVVWVTVDCTLDLFGIIIGLGLRFGLYFVIVYVWAGFQFCFRLGWGSLLDWALVLFG